MWQGKKSKIKHVSLIGDYCDGGLKNVYFNAKNVVFTSCMDQKDYLTQIPILKESYSDKFLVSRRSSFILPNINFPKGLISNYPRKIVERE